MEEQIVNFETAKLAKEKGFNIRVKPFYNGLQDNKLEVSDIIGSSNQLSNWYPAPTQSLLQKWLREEHNIIVISDPIIGFENCNYSWNIYTFNNTWILSHFTAKKFENYEEALEIGLYGALKLI